MNDPKTVTREAETEETDLTPLAEETLESVAGGDTQNPLYRGMIPE